MYNEFDKVIVELTDLDDSFTSQLSHLYVFTDVDVEASWVVNPNPCLPLAVNETDKPSTWHSKRFFYFWAKLEFMC